MDSQESCGCPRCRGVKILPDPSLFMCKWEKYTGVCDLWHQYLLLVKRGNTPLVSCPGYFFDIAECELKAEGQLARKKKEEAATKAYLQAQGII